MSNTLRLSVLALALGCAAQNPAAVYDGGFGKFNSTIELRIGNGGAGQSGLVKALADAYIQDRVADGDPPFRVAWYLTDTTVTIADLEKGITDVGITYNAAAERIAIKQGIASAPSYYAFRDHFLLVGPESNPANLTSDEDAEGLFAALHAAAEGPATTPPVRFLSRYDKSATNIKETLLWAGIGQVPWATAYSTWYHQYIAFPAQALTAAALLEEYTLTDRGTLLSVDAETRNRTVIYKAGGDEDANDPLLNPATILVGTRAKNRRRATGFAEWVVGEKGQAVVVGLKKGGEQLYSAAPGNSSTVRRSST
ncbi:putative extracellular tungstate binding protein [Plectosphaerella plurivora]|uniref:Extracellular tungstate binding protein n=1 Tax=Plectosphaerella plurivora TaxID=936078 RepID=A0A9P8VAC2_9PEZI|nr:putative extracellular tungstate binding protein [Plectosphaerella plurivora]